MPLLMVASILLQFCCLVHVFKTGRPYWWAWIILIGSFLGSAVYLFVEVLPEWRHDPAARRAVRRVRATLDPSRERRELEARLDVADTVANRLKLARERLAAGDVLAAETLFQQSLRGLHATDPDIMLGLAQAQFGRGDPGAARATLDALIAANPQYRSHDGHLLYARALQQLGDLERAADEYAIVVQGFPGEEARVRYGLLLKQLDRHADAQALFRESLKRARAAPKHYRQGNREWLAIAERELGGVAVIRDS